MDKEFWFESEAGIRGHFADEREAEAERHREAMKRLNDAEMEFLDAFRNRKVVT